MKPIAVVVLAAGEGKRMRSAQVKVLHPVCGKPLVYYPVALARSLRPERTVVVVGRQKERVIACLDAAFGQGRVRYAVQAEPLGTGHAVACARSALRGFAGDVLILYGDTPLLSPGRVRAFLRAHRRARAALTAMTATLDDPAGYGRIVRDAEGRFCKIVERRDCTPEQAAIRESNLGIYAVDSRFLFSGLRRLDTDNDQGEFYLTDLVEIANAAGAGTVAWRIDDPAEVAGVNDRWELAQVEAVLRRRLLKAHAERGVTFQDPAAAYVDAGVRIGPDTWIGAGVGLYGATRIGAGCRIGPGSQLADVRVGKGVTIGPHCVLSGVRLRAGQAVEPGRRLEASAGTRGGR